MMKKKLTSGRQRIPIEKISKKSHLQVTFSKRRSGLFKKASELCTLCGVEIAIIVFSPADKAFSFGHPEVESLINRYVAQNSQLDNTGSGGSHQVVEANRNANAHNLNFQLTQILNQLEIEKKRGEELDRMQRARQKEFWWEIPIDELGLHELQHLMFSMEDLKKNIAKYAASTTMLMEQTSITAPIIGPGPGPIEFGHYDAFEAKPAEVYPNQVSSMSFLY